MKNTTKRWLYFLIGLFVVLGITTVSLVLFTPTVKAYDCVAICTDYCRSRGKYYAGARCYNGQARCQCCNRVNPDGEVGSCVYYYYYCSGTLRDCHGGTGVHYSCVNGYHCSSSRTVQMGCCNCYCTTRPPNSPPSCSISFPTDGGSSTITYDAKEYYNGASTVVEDPTARAGVINTRDPNGDTVTIKSVVLSNNCLSIDRSGKDFTLTPQGHVNGVVPSLTSTNSCVTRMTVYVSDGKSTASCSKDITTVYPAPQVSSIKIIDENEHSLSPDTQTTAQTYGSFETVGSSAVDAQTYQLAPLNNEGEATQTLPDPDNRFISTGISILDHSPFTISITVTDENGVVDMDYTNLDLYLREVNLGQNIKLITSPSVTIEVGVSYLINTYGVRSDGSLILYNTYRLDTCLNDPNSLMCIRGSINLYNPDIARLNLEVYPKESANFPSGQYELYFTNAQDLETVPYVKNGTTTSLNNQVLGFLDSYSKTYSADNNLWNAKAYLYIDSTPPDVTNVSLEQVDADTYNLEVTIEDYKPSYVQILLILGILLTQFIEHMSLQQMILLEKLQVLAIDFWLILLE